MWRDVFSAKRSTYVKDTNDGNNNNKLVNVFIYAPMGDLCFEASAARSVSELKIWELSTRGGEGKEVGGPVS